MYLGTAGMKAQMKYADKRGAPCVVIQGGDERAKGEVQIKDLIEGAKAAATIKDSKEWREGRPAQVSVPEGELVARPCARCWRGTRTDPMPTYASTLPASGALRLTSPSRGEGGAPSLSPAIRQPIYTLQRRG